MQALIINFNLDGITRSDYEGLCTELAPAFAAVPGLISKHWLAAAAPAGAPAAAPARCCRPGCRRL